MTITAHPALASLHQLGLINAEELGEANAERDIAAHERLHPPDEPVDMPPLADDADTATTLAWLLQTDLLAEEAFFARLRQLPACQPLAEQALRQVNRQAIDVLYQEDLLNQFQRDAAHARLPADALLATPLAAMRWALAQGIVSPAQLQALQARPRTGGTELARLIAQAAGQPQRAPWRRPPAWKGALAVLGLLVLLACIQALFLPKKPSAPAAQQDAVHSEQQQQQQRAEAAVEAARQPGSTTQYEVTVIQDKTR